MDRIAIAGVLAFAWSTSILLTLARRQPARW
jgi:hypothetical protein